MIRELFGKRMNIGTVFPHESEPAWKRAARLGDGWISLGRPNNQFRIMVEHLHTYWAEAGRTPETSGLSPHRRPE